MKKTSIKNLSFSLILLTILNTGCDMQDSADSNEYDQYKDSSDTTETIVTVTTGAPIYNAFVLDVNDKMAEKVADNSNQYKFIGHIRYPLFAIGGYADVNSDGKIDKTDISNHIKLRTNDGNNLTMLTTYKSLDPDQPVPTNATKENKSDTDIEDVFDIASDDQDKLPTENIKIAAFSQAIFKKAQAKLYTGGTELSNLNDEDFIEDYNNLVTEYTDKLNNGQTEEEINIEGEYAMFKRDENDEYMIEKDLYLLGPSEEIDLSIESLEYQPKFEINGKGLKHVNVVNDSLYSSIVYVFYEIALMQQQKDSLDEAYNTLRDNEGNKYEALNSASNELSDAINLLKSLLNDTWDVFNKYDTWEFQYPNVDNSYQFTTKSPYDSWKDVIDYYVNGDPEDNNDNGNRGMLKAAQNGDKDDRLDYAIWVARFEYQYDQNFAKSMLKNYNPDLQYLFRDIYLHITKSRDLLIKLAQDIDDE